MPPRRDSDETRFDSDEPAKKPETAGLFAGWAKADRFGIVVAKPLRCPHSHSACRLGLPRSVR
ncbi:hypothetical protein ROP_01160 [Rhodococcus opacus B4]|uniref:Uncharacterized protein n=1 Tax=Rhodococcus opacus (strain B4) TaxID=632772 RepID=C1ASB4_RHOOB|nr:hypothetical protein ROP_01160 [Rhodococcus opacus B4]